MTRIYLDNLETKSEYSRKILPYAIFQKNPKRLDIQEYSGTPEDKFQLEFVIIPMDTFKDKEKSCFDLLTYSALDRNLVVYDEENRKNHQCSIRLIALIRNIMRQQYSTLSKFKPNLNYIIYNKDLPQEVIDICNKAKTKLIKTDYPMGKELCPNNEGFENFILGISTKGDQLVNPQKDDLEGLAILDNRLVLFGGY